MARESFEDLEIARLLNESFVSIKVDREERPDIDSLYMAACQAFTGSGGWPTTLFLTPEQLPFFAGTYFPPTSRGGLTGLRQLLSAIRDAWAQDREALTAPGRQFLQLLTQRPPEQSSPTRSLLEEGVAQWKRTYDETYGGFGAAPKFPMGHSLLFLLTYGEKKADPRRLGHGGKNSGAALPRGIYDHIGGGFCRYSTDRAFHIPHFEKMLYDNALLMLAYCKAYAITGRTLYRQVATETAGYLFKEMSLPPAPLSAPRMPTATAARAPTTPFARRKCWLCWEKTRGPPLTPAMTSRKRETSMASASPICSTAPCRGTDSPLASPPCMHTGWAPGPAFIGTIKCWPGGTAC